MYKNYTKMYTKIIQSTKFAYILQYKHCKNQNFVYDNECIYKKCTSDSYIYTKNVRTIQNLYKVQTN